MVLLITDHQKKETDKFHLNQLTIRSANRRPVFGRLFMKKFLIVLSVLFVGLTLFAAEEVTMDMPFVVTSAGQSAEVETVNYILDEVGLPYDYLDVLSIDEFKAGVGLAGAVSGPGKHVYVGSTEPESTPYGTLLLALGASLKGMGASGLSVDAEVGRIKELIEYAKENNIEVLVVAIGGAIRRGLPGSPNEVIIEEVVPSADYVVVSKETNPDDKFNEIADAEGIPVLEIDSAFDLIEVFNNLFSL
jgi:hypothetical protein